MSAHEPRPEPSADAGPSPRTHFEIIGRLADGAMGQVYLARQDDPDRPAHIVLKRIRPELQTDPAIVLMFQDEARIASQMNHPNIVRLYEVGELDGSLFFAMELVEGVTIEHLLSTLVERRRFIPVELALTIGVGVLRALDYAHRFTDARGYPLNIVHRDVSPQNLMVSYGGYTKLLDFGVTRAEGRLHQTLPGLLKGKLAYMAPEAIEGRRIDARADLFSLGAMLYEILLLKHPFFGATDAMVLRSIVEEPPVHPSELDPRFPEPLAELLLAALTKDPAHRIPSARMMADAIDDFLVNQGAPAGGNTQALGAYVRELYADRVAQHERAKALGDDMLMLHALRGFVRHPFHRPSVLSSKEPIANQNRTGPYALPHSLVDLNYARVPTADLPVLKRTSSDHAANFRRSPLDDVLSDAYRESDDEARPRGAPRPLEATLGRYQLLEVIEQSPARRLQHARLVGPLGFQKAVTLRRLPPDRVNDPEWIAPLVREAKLRADLNHPHVEALLDFDDQPEAFYAVEPLDGRHLDQVLTACARGHRPPPELGVVLRIVLDVVDALAYLHHLSTPVLHRCVDPTAVVVHRTGRAKLTSFDLARPIDARLATKEAPQGDRLDRVAPEIVAPQIGAESHATDVYGVGLLIAECLTLSRPFLRDAATTTVQAILHGLTDSVLDDLPPPVRSFVTQATAVDPAQRLPSMAQTRAALLEIAAPANWAIVRDWLAGH